MLEKLMYITEMTLLVFWLPILLLILISILLNNSKMAKYIKQMWVLLLGSIGIYFIVYSTKKDTFQNSNCCPPKGISPLNDPECESGEITECSDGSGTHSVGKIIKGGKYRCMGDGRAYKC